MKFIVRDWNDMCKLFPEMKELGGQEFSKETHVKLFEILSSWEGISETFVQMLPSSGGNVACFLFKVEE